MHDPGLATAQCAGRALAARSRAGRKQTGESWQSAERRVSFLRFGVRNYGDSAHQSHRLLADRAGRTRGYEAQLRESKRRLLKAHNTLAKPMRLGVIVIRKLLGKL